MADYVPLTQQEIIRRMRKPEDDPNYVNDPNRAMLAPALVYGAALAPELEGVTAAGRGAVGEIPAYLASARDVIMRRMGMQTPAAKQAAARLIEPGAADAAIVRETAPLMAPRTAAATALTGTLPMIPLNTPKPAGTNVSDFSRLDYVPTQPAGTNASDFSHLDYTPGPTSVSDFSKLDFVPPKAAAAVSAAKKQSASRMPDVIDLNTKPPINRGQPIDLTSGAASSPGILSRIFSGKDYQSTGQQVVGDNGKVNWGDSDSAADFFRADKARMAQQAQSSGDDSNYARGGAANASPTKEALLHKSLEIIHHMIRNR